MNRLHTSQHWVATLLGAVLLAGTVVPVVQSACAFLHDAAAEHAAVQKAGVHNSAAAYGTASGSDGETEPHCTASESHESHADATASLSPASSTSSHDCHGTCLTQCCSAAGPVSSALASAYLTPTQTDWLSLLAPVLQRTTAVFAPDPDVPVPAFEDESSPFSPVRLHVWTATFLK